METTTADYLSTNMPTAFEFATVTASAADMLHSGEPLQHNQITFEIPSHHDLEHINKLPSFNTLLQRIGNTAYDTVATAVSAAPPETHLNTPLAVDAAGQRITSEQISKSAVLNLADLKSSTTGAGGLLEHLFEGADMHAIINYLWIGVVTSLVILSVIFIVFSCYFYRKFREWKKCNKDIRSNLSNDMYPDGTLVLCDGLMAHGQRPANAAYYQIESPPCYTIATGLPTYDEALHHHQHFSYGMKFMYPSIAAVHHHPAMAGHSIMSNWEKEDIRLQQSDEKQHQRQQQQQTHQHDGQKPNKMTALEAPPAYDTAAAASVVAEVVAASVVTPLLGANEKSEAITICVEPTSAACSKSDGDCVGAFTA